MPRKPNASVDRTLDARRCRICRTPTRATDSKGRPFCACCVVDRMPRSAADDGWSAATLKELKLFTALDDDDTGETEEVL